MALLAITMIGFGNFSFTKLWNEILVTQSYKCFVDGNRAGFVASPCTGPVLASLLTYATSLDNKIKAISLLYLQQWICSNYIILGNFTNKLIKLKVPEWLTRSKFVFATVMFALMFYYLQYHFILSTKI